MWNMGLNRCNNKRREHEKYNIDFLLIQSSRKANSSFHFGVNVLEGENFGTDIKPKSEWHLLQPMINYDNGDNYTGFTTLIGKLKFK